MNNILLLSMILAFTANEAMAGRKHKQPPSKEESMGYRTSAEYPSDSEEDTENEDDADRARLFRKKTTEDKDPAFPVHTPRSPLRAVQKRAVLPPSVPLHPPLLEVPEEALEEAPPIARKPLRRRSSSIPESFSPQPFLRVSPKTVQNGSMNVDGDDDTLIHLMSKSRLDHRVNELKQGEELDNDGLPGVFTPVDLMHIPGQASGVNRLVRPSPLSHERGKPAPHDPVEKRSGMDESED